MALLPKIKLKTLPTFPSTIIGGVGIETTKQNGAVVVDMDWSEFGLQSVVPSSPTNNVLTFDTATNQYVMIPSLLLGGAVAGIADAPVNGIQYGRQNATWTAITATGVSIASFGAVADGSITVSGTGTDNRTAFVNAAATGSRVIVPSGNYRIASNMTIGSEWQFLPGAVLCPDTGVTVTFSNVVYAGYSRIFGNNGVVFGIRQVCPEWFGALRNGSNDDAPAIQKAEKCIEASGGSAGGPATVSFGCGTYVVGSEIVCITTYAFNIHWVGQGAVEGTKFLALAAFSGGSVLKLQAHSNNSDASGGVFSGFQVCPQTAGSGTPIGIDIGNNPTLAVQGGHHQGILFEDISVRDFATCWYIEHVRLIQFRRCDAWCTTLANAKCMRISADSSATPNMFTGDLDFHEFQAVATASGARSLEIAATNSGVIAGVGFHSHIMYAGPASIVATTASTISDIWFTPRFQFDVVTGTGFLIGAGGANSTVRNINFIGGDYAGNSPTDPAFNIFSSAGGRVSSIQINNNFFQNTLGNVISIGGVESVSVSDNFFSDVGTGTLITLASCVGVQVNSNRIGSSFAASPATATGFIAVSSSDYYSIRNNMSSGRITGTIVSDPSPGAHHVTDFNF